MKNPRKKYQIPPCDIDYDVVKILASKIQASVIHPEKASYNIYLIDSLCLVAKSTAATFFLPSNLFGTWSNFSGGLMPRSLWCTCLNFTLYLPGHSSESVFYVQWLLGGSLQESYIKVISKLFCLLIWYLPLFFKILLVTN